MAKLNLTIIPLSIWHRYVPSDITYAKDCIHALVTYSMIARKWFAESPCAVWAGRRRTSQVSTSITQVSRKLCRTQTTALKNEAKGTKLDDLLGPERVLFAQTLRQFKIIFGGIITRGRFLHNSPISILHSNFSHSNAKSVNRTNLPHKSMTAVVAATEGNRVAPIWIDGTLRAD